MSFAVLHETVQKNHTFRFQIIVFANTQGPAACKPLVFAESWNTPTSAEFQIDTSCISQKSNKRNIKK